MVSSMDFMDMEIAFWRWFSKGFSLSAGPPGNCLYINANWMLFGRKGQKTTNFRWVFKAFFDAFSNSFKTFVFHGFQPLGAGHQKQHELPRKNCCFSYFWVAQGKQNIRNTNGFWWFSEGLCGGAFTLVFKCFSRFARGASKVHEFPMKICCFSVIFMKSIVKT